MRSSVGGGGAWWCWRRNWGKGIMNEEQGAVASKDGRPC